MAATLEATKQMLQENQLDLGGDAARLRKSRVMGMERDDPSRIYCLCQQQCGSDPAMIRCDVCYDW